ncbi:2746_t:CDS:2, partial [Scutellospora calospora]
MADTQETKLKYRRGTCFSCRKCLYCGINLQQQRCNCNLSEVSHRDNQTEAVKYAFTRVFKPNWIKEQVEYIHQKIALYNYFLSSKETFNFSLCFQCNSTLLRLSSKAKNLSSFSKIESYDLTISEDEPNKFEERDEWENNEHNNDEFLFDEDSEDEYNYGIVIKLANGTTIPAK